MRSLILTIVFLFSTSALAATVVSPLPTDLNSPQNPKGFWLLGTFGAGFYNYTAIGDQGLQTELGMGGAYYTKKWMHQSFLGLHRFENLDTNNWEYLTRIKLDWTSGYRTSHKWQVGPSASILLNTGEELLSNGSFTPFIGAAAIRDFAYGNYLYKFALKGLMSTNVEGSAFITFASLQIGYAEAEQAPIVREKVIQPDFEVKQIAKGSYRVYLKTVEFDLGKSHLDRYDRKELMKLAKSLNLNSDAYTSILVKGHTDSIGSYKINKRLSKERAERLKAYLMKAGVNGQMIKTKGRADLEPKSAKLISRANRRAELIINSPLSAAELRSALVRGMQ